MTTNTNAALREKLIDLIAEHLSGTYHCTRVWNAWSVGTMSQDDFEDVGESDTPTKLADVILAEISTAAQPQEELREDASYESMNLAAMVLSDCGHSSNYKPLLERVAGRIDRHVERLLTAQRADLTRRAQAEPAQPPAGIWVPTELAERVQETMGEFLMDHGWRQQDMDTSDEFGALLAVATKEPKRQTMAEFLRQPDEVLQPFYEGALREADKTQQEILDSAAPKAEPAQQPERVPLTVYEIDLIANGGMRNALGGIYATQVYEFAHQVQQAFAEKNGIKPAKEQA